MPVPTGLLDEYMLFCHGKLGNPDPLYNRLQAEDAQIAFTTLLRRLPGLRLASEKIEWREGISLRVLKSLHVKFLHSVREGSHCGVDRTR